MDAVSRHTGNVYRDTVTAMGVPFFIELHAPESETGAADAVRQFHAALQRADDVFSPFRDDSELSRLNRGEITVEECDKEMLEILESCEWYKGATLGGFDAKLPDLKKAVESLPPATSGDVTPLPPVSVVKNAEATMQTMARPPGIHPKNADDARTMRSGVLDSAMT